MGGLFQQPSRNKNGSLEEHEHWGQRYSYQKEGKGSFVGGRGFPFFPILCHWVLDKVIFLSMVSDFVLL